MSQVYKFGSVEVRPDERQVLVEGSPAMLGARAFDVLLALIEQRERVLSKNELLETVWPGLVVEENNLQVQVSTLRKILGNQVIATLPGRGYRFVVPLDDDAPAPPAPLQGPVHNLPAPLNSFIGRERQTTALKEALVNARLVTLTGSGGTGKSRLSLHVASQVTGDYPDGVWLVELSPVADEQRVPQVVAFVLGVKEEAGRPLLDSLIAFARTRRMLLILDNCEHLIGGCADLSRRMLLGAPNLKILASSREPLHVSGEARFPVPALDIPTEAVRLFVERATAVHPFFKATPANLASVSGICGRLDGIPLAIELAAARVGTMPVERIAAQLDECFRVLNRGDRAAPTRQQALRASIDWSHDLLSIPERTLLHRLAVFAGGWTLEAAEAVAPGGDVGDDVVDLLTQLVEKSLVEMDELGERYRLLETVRQYASELLVASGDADDLRNRHGVYYLMFAEKVRPKLGGSQSGLWFSRLDAEHENFNAAHRWLDHAPDGPAMGLRLAQALRMYWLNRGYVAHGLRFTSEALARTPSNERTSARCGALFGAGQIACFHGAHRDAVRYLEESVAIARELGEKSRVAAAMQPLSMARLGLGDIAGAGLAAEQAVEILRQEKKPGQLAAAIGCLGQHRRAAGRLDEAEAAYQEALSIAGSADEQEMMAITLLNLAIVAILRGMHDKARAMILEVLAIEDRIGSTHATQSVLEVCAGLATGLGDHERVARYFGAAEAIASQTGLCRDPVDEMFLRPRVDEARAARGAAAFEMIERLGRALSHGAALEEARAWLSGLGPSR